MFFSGEEPRLPARMARIKLNFRDVRTDSVSQAFSPASSPEAEDFQSCTLRRGQVRPVSAEDRLLRSEDSSMRANSPRGRVDSSPQTELRPFQEHQLKLVS